MPLPILQPPSRPSTRAATHWKLTLSYDGSAFHGWQVQPGLPTVQGALADALRRLTGENVLPQGSGRTDAGVHALAQVASFALRAPLPPANLPRALNRTLPQAIRILRAEPMSPGFHARHSACRKTYEYRLFERHPPAGTEGDERICPPFLAPYVWDCRWTLDLPSLETASAHLLGTHNFSSFAAVDPERRDRPADGDGPRPGVNPVKTIYAARWQRDDNGLIFRITGSGFLHHMVRNLVGTLVDVGRGSLTPEDLPRILAARDRAAAGPTAPAQGLFLVNVEYPDASAPGARTARP